MTREFATPRISGKRAKRSLGTRVQRDAEQLDDLWSLQLIMTGVVGAIARDVGLRPGMG